MSVALSVIIVNWNSSACLRTCLQSLYAHPPAPEFEVIVLDSGSFDGCSEMLARDFRAVRFIQCLENGGFAHGNNVAAREAQGPWLLFLNPDTEVRGPGLRRLYEAARTQPDAGALGPRLLNGDGSLQDSCIQAFPTLLNQLLDAALLRRWFPGWRLWGTQALRSGGQEPVAVEGISGACLLTPRAVFMQLGEFCPDYFMYYEDMDYCQRAQAAGFRNYLVPDAEVIHYGGQSSDRAPGAFASVMMAESGWRYFRRWQGRLHAFLFRAGMAVKALGRSLLLGPCSLCHARSRAALVKWRTILWWALGGERALTRAPEYRRTA